jgi:hypothetical protein
MRISCDPGDQGFTPSFYRFAVTFDGQAAPHTITADEELGLVRIVTQFTPMSPPSEHVLFGAVRIHRLH